MPPAETNTVLWRSLTLLTEKIRKLLNREEKKISIKVHCKVRFAKTLSVTSTEYHQLEYSQLTSAVLSVSAASFACCSCAIISSSFSSFNLTA